MLNVTETARERLRKLLDRKDLDPHMVIRVTVSPTNSRKLDLVYGKEESTDVVIRDDAGRGLVVLDAELASALGERTLDFEREPWGLGSSFCMRSGARPSHAKLQ